MCYGSYVDLVSQNPKRGTVAGQNQKIPWSFLVECSKQRSKLRSTGAQSRLFVEPSLLRSVLPEHRCCLLEGRSRGVENPQTQTGTDGSRICWLSRPPIAWQDVPCFQGSRRRAPPSRGNKRPLPTALCAWVQDERQDGIRGFASAFGARLGLDSGVSGGLIAAVSHRSPSPTPDPAPCRPRH